MPKRIVLLLSIGALALAFAAPASGCDGLRPGPEGVVTSVIDGDSVTLAAGTTVRLIGMQAPKLPLGRPDFSAWPLADAARRALESLALDKPVRLAFGGAKSDRHKRVLAHMFVTDGDSEVWVQKAMVAQGLARVYSFADNRACVDELLAAERRARAEHLGIWADPYYSVRSADKPADLLGLAGRFELVEGRVLHAAEAGRLVYLNFGRHWKEDFTVVIDRSGQRLFEQAGLDPLRLAGALVRVRGWIEVEDGPRIAVTHPEQIEVLARQ